jgi:hypothetical protein
VPADDVPGRRAPISPGQYEPAARRCEVELAKRDRKEGRAARTATIYLTAIFM